MDVVTALTSGFTAPLYALPVDIFRMLAGCLGIWYFAHTLRYWSDFTHPDGLIDHALVRRLFPPTRLSLFHPRLPPELYRWIFGLAILASVGVLLGVQTKSCAAYLFVTAVSTYRWNLLVIYVDDAVTHLTFFWLLLMPVGGTLDLPTLLREGSGALDLWTGAIVPGMAVRAFLANMALVYVVAGAYKFTSPMWRDGVALRAILKMPIARAPDFWGQRHAPVLRIFNYVTLILEPVFALVFVLPAGSVSKWLLLIVAAGFHLGIIATLQIPFANVAMLAALPIALAPEITEGFLGLPDPVTVVPFSGPTPQGWVGLGLVLALSGMVLWEIARSGWVSRLPLWKTHMSGFLGNPFYIGLWIIGIAQSYRLFDWVDRRNYHARYELHLDPDPPLTGPPGGPPLRLAQEGDRPALDPEELFPRTLRHLLLQSYLIGNVWLQIDDEGLAHVREALLERHARRFARRHPDLGTVVVHAIVQRITPDNLDLHKGERRVLMRFRCQGGEATLLPVRDTTPEARAVVCAAS